MVEDQTSILNDFFDIEEWAEGVIINGTSYNAIFDNEVNIDSSRDILTTSRNPTLTMRDDDLKFVHQSDIVTIRNKTYKITNLEPDGTGVTTVRVKLV